MKRSIEIYIALLACLFCSPPLLFADDPPKDPFYTQGVQKDAPPINTVSEQIDPFSGVLTLHHTDLHLPGNGGLDLNLVRTYNSMIWGRRDVANPGLIAKNRRSPVGIGWTMHMGIVRNPAGAGLGANAMYPDSPVVEMPDGSQHAFYQNFLNTSTLISKDFWTYKPITGGYEMTTADGTVYTFSSSLSYYESDNTQVMPVTQIRNAANTSAINITYNRTGTVPYSYLTKITDSTGRVVTLNYDYTLARLTSITVDSRTFSYGYTTINNDAYLSTFTPPVGNAWSYGYETAANTYELSAVNFPTGGIIGYTYSNIPFATGKVSPTFRVVTGRTTSGAARGITAGTWSYSYSSGGTGGDTTTITAPGVTETHKFYGWGNTGSGNVWKVGLPMSKSYSGAFTLSESYTWSQGTRVSTADIGNANWTGTGGQVVDYDVYVPFLASKSVTRDGKTYSTTYNTYDTYGNPQSIAESGDLSRNSAIGYWANTAKNIVKGKPSSESVSGGFPGTSSTTWAYDSNSGNITSTTRDGVTTGYGYDASGNLSSITDANNRQTTYLWSNGKVSRATNPIYAVNRAVNSNGTIGSETNGRNYTTSYTYDNNLRLTGITPPAGNATGISYASDSSTRTETRGGYTITSNFDGFGRPTGSSDSRGVTTSISYNAYGAKSSTGSNIGDTVNYDYFGRVTQAIHKDNTGLSYSYSNSNVTVTDENSTSSAHTYNAFGNPDEKYLMLVTDQANNSTSYTRNIQGNITGITQVGVTRSFGYDSTKKNFLTSESNPETGSIGYGRDNVGNMTSKSDSSGTKGYGYDSINRLTSITSGSTISFGYDNANNRTSTTSPGATITYAYDDANRLTSKSETISGRSYTTSYGYDANDNITSMAYPTGRAITYGYNANNQVTSVSGFGGSVSSVNYNTAGLPVSFSYSNGINSTFTYNTRNFNTSIVGSSSAVNLAYGYDSRGNTTTLTNYLDTSKNQSYGYDGLNRLTTFNGAWGGGSFGYDTVGNRTSKVVAGVSTSYGYSSNRMSSASGGEPASYSYNGNGALSGGTWQAGNYTLAYDAFDNLASYKTGGTSLADFTYDGDGIRVSKAAGGKTTVYHYDQVGSVLSENYSDGRLIADYVYLNGKLVAKVAAAPTITSAPASDSFGSVNIGKTSSLHTITIRNIGTDNLIIGTLLLTGTNQSEFTKSSDTCSGQTLVVSATCTVQVALAPTSTGSKTANLSIPSNDPTTPIYNATLNGIGNYPTLSVNKIGSGTGTVTSDLAGISCGSTCSSQFTGSPVVTLKQMPNSDSSFVGWSGVCSGTGACQLTMNADASVTATFNMLPPAANFSARPTTAAGPFTVNFTDLSQRATTWAWNFGDGTTSTAQSPSHTYASRGVYTVSLTVTNAVGSSTVSKGVADFIDITPILMLLLDD